MLIDIVQRDKTCNLLSEKNSDKQGFMENRNLGHNPAPIEINDNTSNFHEGRMKLLIIMSNYL